MLPRNFLSESDFRPNIHFLPKLLPNSERLRVTYRRAREFVFVCVCVYINYNSPQYVSHKTTYKRRRLFPDKPLAP